MLPWKQKNRSPGNMAEKTKEVDMYDFLVTKR